MAFLFNAGPAAVQSEFYHQLGTMCQAGLSLPQSLEALDRSRGFRAYQSRIRDWRQSIERGETFSEAVAHSKGNVPEFDLALLYAGENSGRLDDCFQLLSEYYRTRAENIRETRGLLAYPALVVHAAAFIIPFPALFQSGDLVAYAKASLGVLLPIYILLFVLSWAFNGTRGNTVRRFVELIVCMVPLLGAGLKALAVSRFSLALEALLNAGVSITQAWTIASQASGSPSLASWVKSFPEAMDRGQTPSEWIEHCSYFPELFRMSYTTGEASGRLDENLKRLKRIYEEEGNRKIRTFSQWLPRLIYFGIMFVIARYILSFWTGYYDNIFKSTEF
ncbi:MAG: type II secretion system F family protein [Verrucomicrobia bacterium]|nr:type II secretion system F family protein [Verrucomicrobiota bacterium]